ncbi:hypothetical protein [Amycolatopsis sp. cmx-8-4]
MSGDLLRHDVHKVDDPGRRRGLGRVGGELEQVRRDALPAAHVVQ